MPLIARDQRFFKNLLRVFSFDQLTGARTGTLQHDQIERMFGLTGIGRRIEIANVGEIESQHGDQDENAAKQRKKEELDGGIFAARTAPDADEKVHRQQHHLPKDVKEKEIQGQKRTQHPGF